MTSADDGSSAGTDLARLWSEAAVLVGHAVGCGCGGAMPVRIDPAMVDM